MEENRKKRTKEIKLTDLFPEYTEEELLTIINNFDETNKAIMELRFALNGQPLTSVEEIARLFNSKPQNIYSRINYNKKKINDQLKAFKISEELTDAEPVNKDSKTESMEDDLKNSTSVEESFVSEVNDSNFKETVSDNKDINSNISDEITLETKLSLLENLIKDGKFGNQKQVHQIDDMKIEVKVYDTECLFAHKAKKIEGLDRARGQRKDCLVYVITVRDLKNRFISEKVLVKDKKTNKFIKFVPRYTNGEYDLSDMNEKELVCYDVSRVNVHQIYIKEEPKPKVDITTRKEMPILEPEQEVEDIYTPQELADAQSAMEIGIDLYNNRQIINAEIEFLKALASNKSFVLQKTNYYLGRIYMIKKKPTIAEKYFKTSLDYNENNYNVLLEIAKALIMQGNYDEAIDYLNTCNRINPQWVNHTIEKAKCYALKNDYESALKQYDFAISKKYDDYYAHYEKAKLLYELEMFSEATTELNICDQLIPNRNNHRVIQGKIAFLEGRTDEAKKIFDESVKSDIERQVHFSILNIGHFFHQLGNEALAYEYYNKSYIFRKWNYITDREVENHIIQHTCNDKNEELHSVFNFPASLDILNGLIQDMEKTGTKEMYDIYQLYCENAGYMFLDKDTKEQEDYITILTLPFTKRIMNSYPDRKLPNINIAWSIDLEELKKYADEQRTDAKDEQINTPDDTLSRNVDSNITIPETKEVTSILKLANELFRDKKYDEAELELQKAFVSTNNGTLQKVNSLLGKIYMKKRNWIAAQKYLETSLTYDENNYDVQLELGKALTNQWEFDTAIRYFDACERIRPYFNNHLKEKGICFQKQEKMVEALEQFQLAANIRPNDYYAHVKIAEVLFELGKIEEAVAKIKICEDLMPNKTNHKFLLGKIEFTKGNVEKAKDLFNESIRFNTENNTLNVGYFFHKLGEKELAYEYYQKNEEFMNAVNSSDNEIDNHIKTHLEEDSEKDVHSVFNFPVSLELLNILIADMEKTSTLRASDAYTIRCENVGYIMNDNEKTQLDYITIHTLPFSKKIVKSFAFDNLKGTSSKEVKLEDLINLAEELKRKSDYVATQSDEFKSNSEITTSTTEAEFIRNTYYTILNADIKKLISEEEFTVLNNKMTEYIFLMIRLGKIQGRPYSEEEIADKLGLQEIDVYRIINSGLLGVIDPGKICLDVDKGDPQKITLETPKGK